MTVVVTYCCDEFVTIAAERDRCTLASSLHRVPGVPVVVATAGPSYGRWISRWLDQCTVDPQAFNVDGIAQDFVSAFFSHHDVEMHARFTAAGLRLPEALKEGTKEHALAHAYVVVAGVDSERAKAIATAYRQTGRRTQIDPAPYGRGLIHVVGNWNPHEPAIEYVKPATFDEREAQRILETILLVRSERERLLQKANAPTYDMLQINERSGVKALEQRSGVSVDEITATTAIRALTRHINELRDASFKEGVGD